MSRKAAKSGAAQPLLTWNEFQRHHKGRPQSEVSALWADYKRGEYLVAQPCVRQQLSCKEQIAASEQITPSSSLPHRPALGDVTNTVAAATTSNIPTTSPSDGEDDKASAAFSLAFIALHLHPC